VRMNIVNLAKPDSLYNEGMRVLCYSTLKRKEDQLGWHRTGTDVSYF
jgi:hypothetical protein